MIKTTKQALARAQEFWGKTAIVERRQHPTMTEDKKHVVTHRYVVGRVMLGMLFEVLGDGESWDAAFKQAIEKHPGSIRKGANL